MGWQPRAIGGGARGARSEVEALQGALLAVLDRDLEAAERWLANEAQHRPDAIGPFLVLGRLLRARGEISRAIRVHQTLLLRSDLPSHDRVTALADLAEDFRRAGFLRRAIATHEEVLGHDPRHLGALRALVRLHADVRAFDAALACARRLARIEGREGRDRREDEAALRVEQAEAAHAEGRTDDARRAVRAALRRDPRRVRAFILLGSLEAELGRPRAALAAWQRVPQLDRRAGPQVYPRLAATFAALGRARDHEGFLAGLLEEQPDDAGARVALARALAARGETGAALAELRAIVERDPDDLEAQHALGTLVLAAGASEEALRCYGDLLRRIERRAFFVRESSA